MNCLESRATFLAFSTYALFFFWHLLFSLYSLLCCFFLVLIAMAIYFSYLRGIYTKLISLSRFGTILVWHSFIWMILEMVLKMDPGGEAFSVHTLP